jgi:glycosyltransferase involved in cell wall biosynthesis
MKVLIGPLNVASQPYYLARALRERGVDATCLTYGDHAFGYKTDWVRAIPKAPDERAKMFIDTVKETLEANFDIYHLFQKSLFFSYPSSNYDKLHGFDVPLLKARGCRVAYRFTGWEVFDRQLELDKNPYSAYRHGWEGGFSDELKAEYLDFLREYVDDFMVTDPLMQQHCPEAKIVPRILPMADFDEVGIERTDKPLIVHAPSNVAYKGSKFVLEALEALRDEGVQFELKLLDRAPFVEALEWYKRADIVIDQMLIGWYGVLAMEAMALGKPVAAYMRPDVADAPGEIPVWNMNLDTIKDRLRTLIQDTDLRMSLAARSRDYVQRTHSEDVVIPKLMNVYNDILAKPIKQPQGTGDIDFLLQQRLSWEKLAHERNFATRRVEIQKERMTEQIFSARREASALNADIARKEKLLGRFKTNANKSAQALRGLKNEHALTVREFKREIALKDKKIADQDSILNSIPGRIARKLAGK